MLTATSPLLLMQLAMPSAHLSAAAAWMSAVAFATCVKPRKMLWAGVATGLAILAVPELFRLSAGIALFILFRPERTGAETRKAALMYVGATVVAYAVAFMIVGDALSQPAPGAHPDRDFAGPGRWLLWLDSAVAGLALLAPALLPGSLTMLFLALFAINILTALPGVSVEEWSSLRVLVPTLPLMFVLGVTVIDAGWRRWTLRRDAVGQVRGS